MLLAMTADKVSHCIKDKRSLCKFLSIDRLKVLLISAYGSTMKRSYQEKDTFYENLGVVLYSAKHDKIIIDRIGRDWLSWQSVIG